MCYFSHISRFARALSCIEHFNVKSLKIDFIPRYYDVVIVPQSTFKLWFIYIAAEWACL